MNIDYKINAILQAHEEDGKTEQAIRELISEVLAEVRPSEEQLPDNYKPEAYWSHEQAEGYKTAIDEMERKQKDLGL